MDWTSDWDYLDAAWANDPYPIWQKLRETCPVAHTDRYGGAYLLTRYSDMRDIAYDTDRFSSRRATIREDQSRIDTPPLTSDPPEHRPMRMMLLPSFTPQAMAKLEPQTRILCNKLIDRFIGRGYFDGAVDYAQDIPAALIAQMLGIPAEGGDQFRTWAMMTLQDGIDDPSAMRRAANEMFAFFFEEIEKRRAQPTDDVISSLMQQHLPNGELVSNQDVAGMLRLMLIAGIDTTWSAIGASLWHLATHPADRERLVREPELISTAIEELLRVYAPVPAAREIAEDTKVAGCPMRKGEMLMLNFPSANRDPQKFPDADRVVLDRKDNPHYAFGIGIHRCVGAPLARLELRIAIEELLKRIPEFRLDSTKPMVWSRGVVRGPRLLPLLFDARSGA
ncbi:MAG TPA: cytochrome P450 [Bradyrhizobium sp.]|nr:cytochrome P450 [Bradyrhizobium sp.]